MGAMNTENKAPPASGNSGQRGGRNRRRGGRGRRPANKNPQAAPAAAGANPTPANRPAGSGTRNNRNRRGGQKRQGPKLTGFDLVAANYDKILAEHLEARKRYFEMYYRAQPAQRDKLERVFYDSLDKLYNFAENVPAEHKEAFEQKINGLSFDRVYSERREIPADGQLEISGPEDIEDPHYLESQKNANYKDDTEESYGSIEDYLAYKGP